jgi:Tol biopolymer transport system component
VGDQANGYIDLYWTCLNALLEERGMAMRRTHGGLRGDPLLCSAIAKGTRIMIRLCVLGLLVSVGMTAAGAEGETKPRVDQYGDPLPAGAVLRLGTVRFRQGGPVLSVAYSPEGKTLALGTGDYTVRLWDVGPGKEIRSLQGHRGPVYSVAYSPDGKSLASGSTDKTVRLWDVVTGKEIRSFNGHQDRLWSVAYAPDGKTLASASGDKTVRLWDVANGKEIRLLKGHQSGVISVAYSPDGKTLASGSWDDTVRLWDVVTGKEICTFKGHQYGVCFVAYAPDGKTLASGSGDRTVRLWDVVNGKEIRAIKGHRSWVLSVAYSPDGKTLASGNADNTIQLMETATGKERFHLSGHNGWINALSFSPDGARLVSASVDRTALVWDLVGGVAANVPLAARDLDSSWNALAGADAALAFKAICRLGSDPPRTVPFLEQRMRPEDPAAQEAVEKLATRFIADLDSPTFAVRKKASDELERLGVLAMAVCRQALQGPGSLEVRRRLEHVLAKQEQEEWSPSGEVLRRIRAAEVLERVGTAACRSLLRKLSQGASQARLTREASAALKRLESRPGGVH